MAWLDYAIEHTTIVKDEDSSDLSLGDTTDLDVIEFTVSAGIEAKADTFSFTLNRSNLPEESLGVPLDIQPEHLIKIYAGSYPISKVGANLLMDGKIDKITTTYNENGRVLQVNGVNRLEALLNSVQPTSFTPIAYNVTGVSGAVVTVDGTVDSGRATNSTLMMTSGNGEGVFYHISSVSGNDLTVDGGSSGNTPEADGVAATDTCDLSWNSAKCVEDMINKVNDQNESGKTPNWTTISFHEDNVFVQSDGTALPPVTYSQPYKPSFQQIEELSQDKYTEDGSYIFYLDMDDATEFKVVWKARPTTLESTVFSYDSITDPHIRPTNIRAEHGSFEVVNAIIMDVGTDFNGSSVFIVAYNLTSVGKHGFKWKFVPYVELSKELKEENKITINNTFPYGDVSDWSGGSITVGGEIKTYGSDNAGFRDYLRDKGKFYGTAFVNKLGAPCWRVFWTARGTNNLTLGNIHEVEIPEFGWDSASRKSLRISEISHRFGKGIGWQTTVQLEEDEETAMRDFLEEVGG